MGGKDYTMRCEKIFVGVSLNRPFLGLYLWKYLIGVQNDTIIFSID